MKTSKIVGMVCFSVLFLPLVFTHAQPEPGRDNARGMLKDVKRTLHLNKPAADKIESLGTLAEIAKEMKLIRPQVEMLLNDGDPAVRRQAALTLAEISRTPDDAAEAVSKITIRFSKELKPEVREDLLYALYRMGPHAISALPQVIEEFKNGDAPIRRKAIPVISNLLPHDNKLIELLISALDDPDAGPDEKKPGVNSVKDVTMFCLWRNGPVAKDALPKLKKIAQENGGNESFRMRAFGALAVIAPEDPLALNTARSWLRKKDDPKSLFKGAHLVTALRAHGKAAVPELIDVLNLPPLADQKTDENLKQAAMAALREIGPEAKGAIPTLRAIRENSIGNLRSSAGTAIRRIEGK
jgi:hypothetical protein